jgi:hypothetical protein
VNVDIDRGSVAASVNLSNREAARVYIRQLLSLCKQSEGGATLVMLLDFMIQHLQVVLDTKLLLNLGSLLHGLRPLLLLRFQEFLDLRDHCWVQMETLANQRDVIAGDFSPLGICSLFRLFNTDALVVELSFRLLIGETVG